MSLAGNQVFKQKSLWRVLHIQSIMGSDCFMTYSRARKKLVSFPETPSSSGNPIGLSKAAHANSSFDPAVHHRTALTTWPVVSESVPLAFLPRDPIILITLGSQSVIAVPTVKSRPQSEKP